MLQFQADLLDQWALLLLQFHYTHLDLYALSHQCLRPDHQAQSIRLGPYFPYFLYSPLHQYLRPHRPVQYHPVVQNRQVVQALLYILSSPSLLSTLLRQGAL